jgi:hypothetical protein
MHRRFSKILRKSRESPVSVSDGLLMQASAKHRSDYVSAAPAATLDESLSRYWGPALIAACTASGATIFAAAKLLLAFI